MHLLNSARAAICMRQTSSALHVHEQSSTLAVRSAQQHLLLRLCCGVLPCSQIETRRTLNSLSRGATFRPICTAVPEVLPFLHKMSKHSSWASAMAAMEPNEWCWQNSRQYPVQELLDRLSQVHILKGANARKAMIFFSWSTVTVSVCLVSGL